VVSAAPPAYAWDWLARQRMVWQEIRRRLIARSLDTASSTDPIRRPAAADVPDWAADHPDLARSNNDPSPEGSAPAGAPRDYRSLGTRAEVVAALRADYPDHATIRTTVDAVIGEIGFLGRLDVPLAELGVRSAPRGMRWWWSHLTGRAGDAAPSDSVGDSEPATSTPVQLRLLDVLAGYGDTTGS